jgi:hypothetical protein
VAKTPKKDDAIELLKQDHRKVEGLFKEFERLKEEDEDATAEVIESACMELKIHDKIETEIFYLRCAHRRSRRKWRTCLTRPKWNTKQSES